MAHYSLLRDYRCHPWCQFVRLRNRTMRHRGYRPRQWQSDLRPAPTAFPAEPCVTSENSPYSATESIDHDYKQQGLTSPR